MYKIYQKKYRICKRSVEIDAEREVIRSKVTMNYITNGCEVPFSDIDVEETTLKRTPFKLYFLSIILFIVAIFILPFAALFVFFSFDIFGDYNNIYKLFFSAASGVIAGYFPFFLSRYCFKQARIESYGIALFNRRSNGKACLALFNTGEFEEDYQKFKETLLKELNKANHKNYFIEVIRRADTEFLVNTFRHELIKELQGRGVNIKELLKLISENYISVNRGNVVRFDRD